MSRAAETTVGRRIERTLADATGFEHVDDAVADLVGCNGTRIQVKGAMHRLRSEARRGRLTFWEEPLADLLDHGGVYLLVVYDADPLRVLHLEERSPPAIRSHLEGRWEAVDHRDKGRRARVPWNKVVTEYGGERV